MFQCVVLGKSFVLYEQILEFAIHRSRFHYHEVLKLGGKNLPSPSKLFFVFQKKNLFWERKKLNEKHMVGYVWEGILYFGKALYLGGRFTGVP